MHREEEQRLLSICHAADLPFEHEHWKRLESFWEEEYLFHIYLKIEDFEHKDKAEIKEKIKEFVTEVTIADPEFVKDARIRYLKDQIIYWEAQFLKTENKKLIGKINWMKTEIKNWENPGEYDPSAITDDDIQRAKEVDCENYVDIVRTEGDKSWAKCPFHEEKTASFCCYKGDRGYHCYGCKASGDTIDLVQKRFNKSFPQAIRMILNKN